MVLTLHLVIELNMLAVSRWVMFFPGVSMRTNLSKTLTLIINQIFQKVQMMSLCQLKEDWLFRIVIEKPNKICFCFWKCPYYYSLKSEIYKYEILKLYNYSNVNMYFYLIYSPASLNTYVSYWNNSNQLFKHHRNVIYETHYVMAYCYLYNLTTFKTHLRT